MIDSISLIISISVSMMAVGMSIRIGVWPMMVFGMTIRMSISSMMVFGGMSSIAPATADGHCLYLTFRQGIVGHHTRHRHQRGHHNADRPDGTVFMGIESVRMNIELLMAIKVAAMISDNTWI